MWHFLGIWHFPYYLGAFEKYVVSDDFEATVANLINILR